MADYRDSAATELRELLDELWKLLARPQARILLERTHSLRVRMSKLGLDSSGGIGALRETSKVVLLEAVLDDLDCSLKTQYDEYRFTSVLRYVINFTYLNHLNMVRDQITVVNRVLRSLRLQLERSEQLHQRDEPTTAADASRGYVFVSYVRANHVAVERLCRDLRSYGISLWLDQENILPGQKWRSAIRAAIREGGHFLACFSGDYSARRRTYMNEELLLAIEELRLRPFETSWFIPVRLDDSPIPVWEIGGGQLLTDIQWVDLYESWETGTLQIVQAIRFGTGL